MEERISYLLQKREFISVATCDLEGRPNCAPKFLFKTEGSEIFLVDYTFGRTCENLRKNPRASLSVMDIDNLVGYVLNGSAEIIERDRISELMLEELRKREIRLSAMRLIEGVKTGKRSKHFELEIPEKFSIIKICVEEIVRMGLGGEILRGPEKQ